MHFVHDVMGEFLNWKDKVVTQYVKPLLANNALYYEQYHEIRYLHI